MLARFLPKFSRSRSSILLTFIFFSEESGRVGESPWLHLPLTVEGQLLSEEEVLRKQRGVQAKGDSTGPEDFRENGRSSGDQERRKRIVCDSWPPDSTPQAVWNLPPSRAARGKKHKSEASAHHTVLSTFDADPHQM